MNTEPRNEFPRLALDYLDSERPTGKQEDSEVDAVSDNVSEQTSNADSECASIDSELDNTQAWHIVKDFQFLVQKGLYTAAGVGVESLHYKEFENDHLGPTDEEKKDLILKEFSVAMSAILQYDFERYTRELAGKLLEEYDSIGKKLLKCYPSTSNIVQHAKDVALDRIERFNAYLLSDLKSLFEESFSLYPEMIEVLKKLPQGSFVKCYKHLLRAFWERITALVELFSDSTERLADHMGRLSDYIRLPLRYPPVSQHRRRILENWINLTCA